MSLQVFLQAQLLGAEEFLIAPSEEQVDDISDLMGRSAWLGLLCEVIPRALLAELKLSQMLLGSSSAEQFLLVLTEEEIPRANDFLAQVREDIRGLSGGTLDLVWGSTENLGAWPIVRKRLDDSLAEKMAAPLAGEQDLTGYFTPLEEIRTEVGRYFSSLAEQLPAATKVGWSSDKPAHLTWDGGQYSWALREQSVGEDDGILFPRRFAMDDTGAKPSSLVELAERADGAKRWGILRGDVDGFDTVLRRLGSIEEHIHLSALLKKFFAGELSLLCTLPDFWRNVTILYRGGDDFLVVGTWDALVMLARELQRLFEKFVEQTQQAFPDLEGRTISMALAIAPDAGGAIAPVLEQATKQLRNIKASDAGTFYLFGRALEWNRLNDAEELKSGLTRLVREFGYAPDYINDLASVYREAFSARASRRGKAVRVDKPWRTYMRVSRVIPHARGKETNNVRNSIIASLAGRKTAGFKLRPSARVGLEWARLAAGGQASTADSSVERNSNA